MSRGPAFFRKKSGRRDGPHAVIRDALRKLGHLVIDCAGVGDGVPDLVVYPRGSTTGVWLEVKTAKGKLRPAQVKFMAELTRRSIPNAVVRDVSEAVMAVKNASQAAVVPSGRAQTESAGLRTLTLPSGACVVDALRKELGK
jgi:hypothetical protein